MELRVEHCRSDYGLSPQCMTVNTILMDLTQVFIDNTGCKNQPVILVPLDDKEQKTSTGKTNNMQFGNSQV